RLPSASRRRAFASTSKALSVPRRDIRSANLMATFGILFHLPAVRGVLHFLPTPRGGPAFLPAVRGGWREAPGGELNQCTPASAPPSTPIVWPVMYAACFEQSKAHVAANSAGSPSRRSGELAATRVLRSFG